MATRALASLAASAIYGGLVYLAAAWFAWVFVRMERGK